MTGSWQPLPYIYSGFAIYPIDPQGAHPLLPARSTRPKSTKVQGLLLDPLARGKTRIKAAARLEGSIIMTSRRRRGQAAEYT